MTHAIWFMTGLSSQGDIIYGIKNAIPEITLVASHQQPRYEILAGADHAYLEPALLQRYDSGGQACATAKQPVDAKLVEPMLDFMGKVVAAHQVSVIHTPRHSAWFETQRPLIESWGVRLVTGAQSLASFAIADDKQAFADQMQSLGLPVVPTLTAASFTELADIFQRQPFGASDFCIKPAKGIYGMGFWHLDTQASLADADSKRIHPAVYLAAARSDHERGHGFAPQVIMPYLPGAERSVDILMDKGQVITAIGRCKQGALQTFERSGAAFELALECARQLGLDGLVNVQTRDDAKDQPLLLETNLRPSGGICFSLASGVNLPALFAQYVTGRLSASAIQAQVAQSFKAGCVRSTSTVLSVPDASVLSSNCHLISPSLTPFDSELSHASI